MEKESRVKVKVRITPLCITDCDMKDVDDIVLHTYPGDQCRRCFVFNRLQPRDFSPQLE